MHTGQKLRDKGSIRQVLTQIAQHNKMYFWPCYKYPVSCLFSMVEFRGVKVKCAEVVLDEAAGQRKVDVNYSLAVAHTAFSSFSLISYLEYTFEALV